MVYRPVLQTCTTDLYAMVYRPVLQTCIQWYTDLYYRLVCNGIQTCITDLYTMVYRPVYNGIQTCIQWYTDLYTMVYRPVHNVSKPLHVKFKDKIPFNGGSLERSERILSFYANHYNLPKTFSLSCTTTVRSCSHPMYLRESTSSRDTSWSMEGPLLSS